MGFILCVCCVCLVFFFPAGTYFCVTVKENSASLSEATIIPLLTNSLPNKTRDEISLHNNHGVCQEVAHSNKVTIIIQELGGYTETDRSMSNMRNVITQPQM